MQSKADDKMFDADTGRGHQWAVNTDELQDVLMMCFSYQLKNKKRRLKNTNE